jgi:hypothetical protein
MVRPYAVHGWTVTSDKPFKTVWIWWNEGGPDGAAALDKGAKFVNPETAKDEKTALPYAVPLPPVRKAN